MRRRCSLAIWLMSPNAASTSAVSARRSITLRGETASTLRITLPPHAAAVARSMYQQGKPMASRRHVGPALGNWCEVVRQMPVLKGFCRKEKEIEVLRVCTICLKGKIYMCTSSRKLKWLLEENAQLRGDFLRLKQT